MSVDLQYLSYTALLTVVHIRVLDFGIGPVPLHTIEPVHLEVLGRIPQCRPVQRLLGCAVKSVG